MSKILSILATCLLTCWATYAQAITPENIQDGGKYYFYNVGSGRWLAAGNSWSTRASLLTHAEYQILKRQPSGKYTLLSQVGGSQNSQWLGANLFLDTSNPIELTIAESGSHSTIACGDSILGYDGSTTELYHAATGNNALWDIYSEEEMLQRLRQATSTSPVDATFLILDPNFGRYNVNQSAWTIEASNHNLSGGSETNRCAESWHSIFTLSQTLSNAPAGIYKLVAQGFYRQDDASENPLLPYFYANNAKVTFPQISGTENSMADASASFTNGLYTSSPIYVEVTEGEELTIGARNEESLNLWCIWDNFELTYYGTDGDINDFTGALPKENWQQAHAAAEAALADSTYANVMGSERVNLRAEVDKAEPTDNEGYTSATEALKTATQTFIDAAPAYDGIMAEIIQALNVGLNTREAELLIGSSTTTAADIIAATQDLKLQEYQTVNAQYTYNASHVLGRWESTYSRLTGQDYADDGHTYYDIWSSDSTTPTATQTLTLPAGNYVFKVLGRGQVGASQQMRVATTDSTYTMPFIMAGDTGLGTNKAGVTSFEPNDAEGFAYDGAGRGWQWRYIAFQMAEAGEVTFTVTGHIQSQWISWDAPTLLSDAEIVLPTYITFADPAVESICLNRWDSNHDGLLSFDEAEAVTSLGNAFTDNASITSFNELKYFTRLEDLGDETFRNCQSLDTLTLPRNLWRIGRRAFAGCTALRGITIPANVVSLGYHAFSGCTKLKTVVSNILCPQPINNTVFEDIAPDATLYVQTETGYHYQEAAGWNSFANINASVYSEWYWPEDDYQTVMHFTSTDSTIVTLEKRINESDFIVNPDNTMFFRTEYVLGLRKGDMKHTMALADDLYTGSFSNLWMVPCAVLDRTKQQLFIFASSKQPANNYAESGHAFRINLNNYETTRETVFTDANWGWHSYFDCTDVEAPVVKHFSSAGYFTIQSTRNSDGTWNNEQMEPIMPEEFTAQSIQRPQLLILDTLTINLEQDAAPVENIVFADSIVKRICVENWDTNGDGELSKDEAAAVEGIGQVFQMNDQITSFDELQYFTGLTSIADSAFYNCSHLANITIPSSVTSIGESAFYGCSSLNSVDLPSVTSIGRAAFCECSSLAGIDFPAATSIGNYAFGFCSSLTRIDLPAAISIGGSAFSKCSSLASIDLPAVTSIGGEAFDHCTSLTSIDLPSATSIGDWTFSYCTSLTSISLPASTSIGEAAYYECTSLTSIELPAATTIGDYAFADCNSLTSIDLPAATSIGGEAFDHCTSLTSIDLPSATSIGDWTFSHCTSLTSISLPSVTSIGDRAFLNCSSLTSITIPASCTSVGVRPFVNCNSLESIIVDSANPIYNDGNGSNCIIETATNTLISGCKNTSVPSTVTGIGDGAFNGCSALTSVSIPASVTNIEHFAFYGCASLTDVYSEIVEPFAISDNVFEGIDSLATLHVPSGTVATYQATQGWPDHFANIVEMDGPAPTDENIVFADSIVKRICVGNWDTNGDGELSMEEAAVVTDLGLVFRENNSISSFDELQYFTGLTSIADSAFYNCSHLATITIPSFVTNIGDVAFQYCSSLTSISAPSATSIGNWAFSVCRSLTSIDLPVATSIGNWAFHYCLSLVSISLPAATSIGNDAFLFCYSLTNFDLPVVTSIGASAFHGCPLTSATIPASWTSIEDNPFSYCDRLENIIVDSSNTVYNDGNGSNCIIETVTSTLISGCKNTSVPSTVTSIGSSAFSGCSSLTSIDLPPVTSIGRSAFSGCSSLTSIDLSAVTSIGSRAFSGCRSLTSITLSASLNTIGSGTFDDCRKLVDVYSEIIEPFAISTDVFQGIASLATLHVPYGTAEAYRTTPGWPDHFANIVEMDGPAPSGEPIAFADAEVKRICVERWDTNRDGKLNTGEAAQVTDLGNAFTGNTSITSFDELQHFTGLQTIGANAFEGCAALRNITIPANVTSLGQDAFKGTTSLITIDWQGQLPLTTQTLAQAGIESRSANQLMYVTGDTPVEVGSDFAAQWIVDGQAEELVLTDGEPLWVTRAFHAAKATYSRTFSKESGRGESAGWETLALPFDVQRIESLTKGELQPFGVASETALPFWLRQWTGEDFRSATAIKANTPYIISMPNNKMYYEEYNVKGRVRFMAEDVDIQPMDTNTQQGAFHYTYLPVAAAPEVYALNNDTYETQDHKMFRPGGVFVSDLRGVRPFEAYFDIAESAGGREYIPILLDDATHIDELVDGTASTLDLRSAIVYDLQGRRVNGQRSTVNSQWPMVNGQLKKGLYILHSGNGSLRGKKQLVK